MQPSKKRLIESPSGHRTSITTQTVPIDQERRKQMMAAMNIIEPADEHVEPEWELEGTTYSDTEDLLNIEIPPKPQDLVTDPEGHRLIIHDIYVNNFKSYKGTHQLGPFHKNLTMILGPNGSGKSNIIDALLFVFGFKNKKIRTNKLTSLIHSSDECRHCKVEVHFQVIKDITEEKYIVIPDSAFRISRLVRKDGVSQYKLNGIIVKQEEITSLLKKVGIDLNHNRFLILQGEVEAIALMKPTTKSRSEPGMLEYIEDIVGTHRYVAPIAKLAHRVALLEIKASRYVAGKRRNEAALKEFIKPMELAVAYLNASNHLNYMHGCIRISSLAKMRRTREEILDSIEKHKENLEKREHEKAEALKTVKKQQNRETKLQENLQTAIILRVEKEQEISEWHVNDERRKNGLKACTRDLVKLNKEKELALKEKEEAMLAPEKSTQRLEGMHMEMKELLEQEEKSKKVAAENLVKFDAKSKDEKSKRDKFAAEFATRNEQSNAVQTELSVVENELRDMKVTAKQDEKRLDELKTALEGNLKKIDKDQEDLDRVTAEIAEVSKTLETANQHLPGLQTAERDMRGRKQHLQAEIDEKTHQVDQITYKHPSTARLHELKESGGFPGFYGRLGDLGRVEKKYDPVLSTVFSQLDWHIVETEADQIFAMNWVYEHKLPRTTFFHLELLKKFDVSGMNASPNRFPGDRLFDQIQCDDPQVRKVFYYIVQDLIVVPTLAEATKIDKKFNGRHRVCCIDGSLIERSGNISGGGKPLTNRIRTDNGPRNSTSDKKNLDKLQSQMTRIRKEHESIAKRCSSYQETIRKCQPLLRNLQEKANELRYTLPKQRAAVAALKEAIKEKEEKMKEDVIEITVEDIETKREHVETLKQRLEDLQVATEDSREALDNCQRKLDKMFYELVQKHKDAAAKSRDRVEFLEQEIAKEEAFRNNAPAHQEAAKRKYEELEKQYRTKRLEADALSAMETEGELKELMDLNKELDQIKSEIASIEEKMRDLKVAKLDGEATEREALRKYQNARAEYEELLGMADTIEGKIAEDQEAIERLENNWMYPETCDPHARLIRFDEEDAEDLISSGEAVGIPPDVIERVEDWKTKFEGIPNELLNSQEADRIANEIVAIEKSVEQYRREFDEKGISHYSQMVALVHGEDYDHEMNNAEIARHREKLAELRRLRLQEFSEALSFLGTTTQMLYQMITNGGDASLKFVEEGKSSDPFDAGIKFSVRPAKKSWKLIENLSGGEKTLASLCFVFAVHHYRATPLYVMDEIDAALDLNNVRLIANYVKFSEKTKNAQFIIISLRNQMFEVASRLIGIYKVNGCTHNVVIAPDRVENENRGPKETLYVKIREEERKRKEAAAARAENMITEGMQNVAITKRRRKLGKLCLAEFGLEDDDEEVDEPNNHQPLNLLELETEHNPFDDESDEEPVRRRRRVQVQEESDEEELSPTPPPQPKPTRGRRGARR